MSIMLRSKYFVKTCALFFAFSYVATMAVAKSAQDERDEKVEQIPVCSKSFGTLAVIEPEAGEDWWTGQKLPSPTVLVKYYVKQSKCFTLVDRSTGFNAAMAERELAAGGALRRKSNIGLGQIKAADYVMIPELASQNANAGGNNIGGLLGGLMGGKAGAIVGGLNLKKKTADVSLTVTDVRSSEQVAITEGHGKKTDLGFNAAGALFTGGGVGAAGVGGYADTELGQVIALAYLDAYTSMISQFRELPESAAAAADTQAVEMTKPARMLADPKGAGGAVRDLEVGMLLYPTGNKEGVMWEVEDELGNKGWVSSTLFQLAQ